VSVQRAIVLAAGLGLRLRPGIEDRPKGLIEFGAEPIVARSIRLLRQAGIVRTTIVIGYRGGQYRTRLSGLSSIDFVENPDYESTGSMASLAIALAGVDEPVIVVESDIVYEPRALDALAVARRSATIVSGITGAGDEVWVRAPTLRLEAMSKEQERVPDALGEFVGITCLSADGVAGMRGIFSAFAAREGHGRMAYDTDALVELAQRTPIDVIYMPDLVWGEIDDDSQYQRVASVVWPALNARRLG
jgi:2-aminoethylphosphonate-pyruvate transaminase